MSEWKKVEHDTFRKVDSQRTIYIDATGNFNANVTHIIQMSNEKDTIICNGDFLRTLCCSPNSDIGFLTIEEFDRHIWQTECLSEKKSKMLFDAAYQIRLLYYYEVPYCPYKKSIYEKWEGGEI